MAYKEIRQFGRIADTTEIPNLTEIQKFSYAQFLQEEVSPDKRKQIGLEALLREIFPIVSYNEEIQMEYHGYELGKARYTPDECRQLRLTYGKPFRIRCRLVRKDSEEIMEDSIYLGEIPSMIGGGEFIINGAERVIVNQLHRSPGVDFVVESQEGDRPLHGCRVIPERGSWIEINVTKKDILVVRIDQSSKLSATTFLRAMDEKFSSTEAILREFYPTKKVALDKLKAEMWAVGPIVDKKTGEELVAAGCQISDKLQEIQQSSLSRVEVIEKVTDELILNTLAEDNTTNHDEALLRIYARLRPGNPAQLKKAKQLFNEKFYDTNRYRLGKVGRFRVNRKFHQTVSEAEMTLRPDDILNSLKYIVTLRAGEGSVDDIDHLGNRRLRTIGELAADEIRKGFLKLRRSVQERMSLKDINELGRIAELINSKSVTSSIDFFFGRGELSQVVDQTNPLSQLTHERRLSALGPGGLNRKRAGFEVRDVHISHYGRICPIETPEGTNIGLISSLGIYASVDQYGFLVTPYRKIEKGRPTGVAFLRADQEIDAVLAPVDVLVEEIKDSKIDEKKVKGFLDLLEGAVMLAYPDRDQESYGNSPIDLPFFNEDPPKYLPSGPDSSNKVVKYDKKNRRLDKESLSEFNDVLANSSTDYLRSLIRKATGPMSSFPNGWNRPTKFNDPSIPTKPGIYFFRREGKIVYVGQAGPRKNKKDLQERLKYHCVGSIDVSTFREHVLEFVGKEDVRGKPIDEYLPGLEFTWIEVESNKIDPNVEYKVRDGVVLARIAGDLSQVDSKEVQYVDISSRQTVGISASLIPFLEHDDANRALMGSNMQRQAVPLLTTEPPIIATGMEEIVAQNSSMLVRAGRSGTITYVDAIRIVIDHADEYALRKFVGLNERTCLNQVPIVKLGQKVEKNQIIADGAATSEGQLALGKNLLVGFMMWDGYNFEDAILVSERLVKDDVFTSIHIEEYDIEIRETKLGREEFTRDIPNVSEKALANLDEGGVIRHGTYIEADDILVGKVSPKSKSELSPEEKLLYAIFGRAGEDVKNDSLVMPSGQRGIVIDTKRFSRRMYMGDEQRKIQNKVMKQYQEGMTHKIAEVFRQMAQELTEKLGSPIVDPGTKQKIGKSAIDEVIMEQVENFDVAWIKPPARRKTLSKVSETYMDRINELKEEMLRKLQQLKRGDELPSGVLEMVKIYVATKRRLSVGDKMAGRHGNKGVIARILPEEDMPFLEDGTSLDICLNPLGVPGRMNVGQILETHLGWAAWILDFQAFSPVFDGATEDDVHELIEEANEKVRSVKKQCQQENRPPSTDTVWVEMPYGGKVTLYDGRTGEPFEQKVTVGYIYMMKLHHLVDDKIHARATGPYSLITQQPLGGKARTGGQRFGEMEVWGLEAYGSAYMLQELLTVKSDDVEGRTKIYEAMVKGTNTLEAGTPVSFDVLCNEVRGLGLNIQLEKKRIG